MKPKIWLSSPHMGGNETKYIQEAFDTNWIAPLGPHVDAFEKALCTYTGVKHAAALSSGTAALHLALILVGVGYGDEVLCQSFTFSASANPIAYQGATPIFIDSERETWNMCPVALEEAIKDRLKKNKKPKAVIVVHLYGMPAQMTAIQAICEQYGIPLIEDAAEALGSTYKGQAMGSFGKLGILSFNGNKIITTSGGGALLGNEEALITKSRFLATQARDPAPHYQHSHIGYNYRLSNVCAAIGLGQMEVLPTRIERRRANFHFYQEELKAYPFIEFQPELADSFSNRWLSALVVNESAEISREDLRLALEAENIEARPLWKPLHLQPVFEEAPYYGGGVCEDLFNRGLCLPSGSNLSQEDLTRIVDTIKTLF
ncbi:DegT/DnrJ/EryC1/StrS family aminotransferase [Tellurirhabdus bombi]|uniref:DegT/DnrJ/EryC1/StrS family aminotransferase n=1 Tax=Tellurirhabdus bombi TaxID=2907205 RepID=UPI001F28D566|nr:aminotransferase class I/II-fold pyridoxal phosphate-dependent enzyme [Tellurirhabdus bombi]